MPLITIGNIPINFPNTGNSPVWSDAVIQFAEAVANAINATSGPYDIPPQVYNIIADTNTGVSIPNLQFPVTNVRGAFIYYTVARVTNTASAYETGVLQLSYQPDRSTPGTLWDIQREYNGEANVTFAITDAGQVTFSSAPLGGVFQSGQISFFAHSLISE
jgi:hypothetical protein